MKNTYCKTEKAKGLVYLLDDKSTTLAMISAYYLGYSIDNQHTHEMLEAINNEGVCSVTDEYSFTEYVNQLVITSKTLNNHQSDKPYDYFRPSDNKDDMSDDEYALHLTMESIYCYKDRLLMCNI